MKIAIVGPGTEGTRWLRRHPSAMAAAISGLNRVDRLVTTSRGRSVFAVVAIALSGSLVLTLFVAADGPAFAIRQALSHAGMVVAASGLYAASLMSRRRRNVEAARATSWLVATPRMPRPLSQPSGATTALLTTLPLLWRLAVAVAFALLLSLDTEVTVGQSLQLSALIATGSIAGAPCGWWWSHRSTTRRKAGSRYAPRRKHAMHPVPSSTALSHWPIAQAFAWGRPENARLLVGAAILMVPGGTGILGALFLLVMWVVGSYLVALLVAIPHVARSASRWLRCTPITFGAFAWPLARRALLHQLLGALLAMGFMLTIGAAPLTAVYLGTLWLTLVVLTDAMTLSLLKP